MSYIEGTAEIWSTTERAKLLAMVAVLPDPRRVAESLDIRSLLALVNAESDWEGGYKIRRSEWGTHAARELIEAGIVESKHGGIGNFGMTVRRVAIRMKLDGELG